MTQKKEDRLFGDFFWDLVHALSRNEKKIYIYLGVFLSIILILAGFHLINVQKVFAFILFVVIGGLFKFLISKFKIWVEFTPIMFFCVLIAHYMGIVWVIPYIIIADIMAALMGGEGPTAGSVPYWFWMFLIAIISLPFDLESQWRTLIPLIYFAGGLAIEGIVKGGLNPWRWGSSVANLVINLYFFVKLTDFFVGIVA